MMADAFDRWLRDEGYVFRRDRMDKATTCIRGWPDFEIIRNSRVLFIELKTDKGRLSRDQVNLHKRLADVSTAVHVCRTLDAAIELVRTWESCYAPAPCGPASADDIIYWLGKKLKRLPDGSMEIVK